MSEMSMDFNLLKEFLNSDVTQKEFARSKNRSMTAISSRLTREMRKLLNTEVIDVKNIIFNTSLLIYDVRQNKEQWLKAIKSYEETVSKPVEILRLETLSSTDLFNKAIDLLTKAFQKNKEENISMILASIPQPKENIKPDLKISRRDIKAKYKISYPTIHNYMNNGTLPFQRLGGKVYFLESDVEKAFVKVNLRKKDLKFVD